MLTNGIYELSPYPHLLDHILNWCRGNPLTHCMNVTCNFLTTLSMTICSRECYCTLSMRFESPWTKPQCHHWYYQFPLLVVDGGASRPFSRDGSVEELHRDPTVWFHSLILLYGACLRGQNVTMRQAVCSAVLKLISPSEGIVLHFCIHEWTNPNASPKVDDWAMYHT